MEKTGKIILFVVIFILIFLIICFSNNYYIQREDTTVIVYHKNFRETASKLLREPNVSFFSYQNERELGEVFRNLKLKKLRKIFFIGDPQDLFDSRHDLDPECKVSTSEIHPGLQNYANISSPQVLKIKITERQSKQLQGW